MRSRFALSLFISLLPSLFVSVLLARLHMCLRSPFQLLSRYSFAAPERKRTCLRLPRGYRIRNVGEKMREKQMDCVMF
jgi:hypothetical protein